MPPVPLGSRGLLGCGLAPEGAAYLLIGVDSKGAQLRGHAVGPFLHGECLLLGQFQLLVSSVRMLLGSVRMLLGKLRMLLGGGFAFGPRGNHDALGIAPPKPIGFHVFINAMPNAQAKIEIGKPSLFSLGIAAIVLPKRPQSVAAK